MYIRKLTPSEFDLFDLAAPGSVVARSLASPPASSVPSGRRGGLTTAEPGITFCSRWFHAQVSIRTTGVTVVVDLLGGDPAAEPDHVGEVDVGGYWPCSDLSTPASPIQLVSEWICQQVRWMPTS